MNASYTFADPATDLDLLGPDLTALPTLAQQLAVLDEARATGDIQEYVTVWLDVSDANGSGASAVWMNDDGAETRARIYSGFACDSQHDARRERWEALHDHSSTVAGFHAAMQTELLVLRRFVDNRRSSTFEIKAVVRAFLANGGKLLLPPSEVRRTKAEVEASFNTAAFLKDEWSDAEICVATAIQRILNRWRAQQAVKRIVRALGTPAANGWIVLEAKA